MDSHSIRSHASKAGPTDGTPLRSHKPNELRASVLDAALQLGIVDGNQVSEWILSGVSEDNDEECQEETVQEGHQNVAKERRRAWSDSLRGGKGKEVARDSEMRNEAASSSGLASRTKFSSWIITDEQQGEGSKITPPTPATSLVQSKLRAAHIRSKSTPDPLAQGNNHSYLPSESTLIEGVQARRTEDSRPASSTSLETSFRASTRRPTPSIIIVPFEPPSHTTSTPRTTIIPIETSSAALSTANDTPYRSSASTTWGRKLLESYDISLPNTPTSAVSSTPIFNLTPNFSSPTSSSSPGSSFLTSIISPTTPQLSTPARAFFLRQQRPPSPQPSLSFADSPPSTGSPHFPTPGGLGVLVPALTLSNKPTHPIVPDTLASSLADIKLSTPRPSKARDLAILIAGETLLPPDRLSSLDDTYLFIEQIPPYSSPPCESPLHPVLTAGRNTPIRVLTTQRPRSSSLPSPISPHPGSLPIGARSTLTNLPTQASSLSNQVYPPTSDPSFDSQTPVGQPTNQSIPTRSHPALMVDSSSSRVLYVSSHSSPTSSPPPYSPPGSSSSFTFSMASISGASGSVPMSFRVTSLPPPPPPKPTLSVRGRDSAPAQLKPLPPPPRRPDGPTAPVQQRGRQSPFPIRPIRPLATIPPAPMPLKKKKKVNFGAEGYLSAEEARVGRNL